MALASDLLAQARMLAQREPQRPRQASLRRAVSTAYYALFHLLVDAASRELVSGNDAVALRGRVARAFDHGEMKKLCRGIATWNAKAPPIPVGDLLNEPPSDELTFVARTFVELQQARHEADYDLTRRFSRDDVAALIEIAEEAFRSFRALDRRGLERRVFVIGLAFHGRWNRV